MNPKKELLLGPMGRVQAVPAKVPREPNTP